MEPIDISKLKIDEMPKCAICKGYIFIDESGALVSHLGIVALAHSECLQEEGFEVIS